MLPIILSLIVAYIVVGGCTMFIMDDYNRLTNKEAVGVMVLWPAFIIKGILLILRWVAVSIFAAFKILF